MLATLVMPVNGSQEYGCKMCGKKLGDSLGDMERHILTEHMQRQDFSNLKNKIPSYLTSE